MLGTEPLLGSRGDGQIVSTSEGRQERPNTDSRVQLGASNSVVGDATGLPASRSGSAGLACV